ncbi:putative mitochondrial transferase [Cavenderia fasciculata]|uniref:Mitochondrial transferase n=1 Tax=Cavenderia fasciculata TaxID=261658 RepID=F4PGN8_CACFS|nr:putative mitochondrial transferase [Cavenderia fasciculata]EGG24872.1 putative mitochondrial transferase [Cavenderia fasciculata]|eukprot:XP_004362723.1 putative mitochondrial transferase [Cavenderia fasciculata]
MNLARIKELKRCVVPLKNRTLVRVSGKDSVKFLQGLTTNNLTRLSDNQNTHASIYTGFLASTGRLLFDAIVSLEKQSTTTTSTASTTAATASDSNSATHSYIVDVDSAVADKVFEHLKFYKMRDKVTIEDATQHYSVMSVLDKTYKTIRNDKLFEHLEEEQCSVMMDPRHDNMGIRILVPNSKTSIAKKDLFSTYSEEDEELYHLYRLQNGIPEGLKDYNYNTVIPLEYNFDLLNGVDFHKGCYLGQELTSRTHYTGLIRKRIFPVTMKAKDEHVYPKEDHLLFSPYVLNSLNINTPPSDTELKVTMKNKGANSPFTDKEQDGPSPSSTPAPSAGRSTEKFISGRQNVGLAMIKVEHIDAGDFKHTIIKDKESRQLQLLEPCWWGKVVGIVVPTQQVS